MKLDALLNQIVCADCLTILPDLPDQCVKLIFSDPPYNRGVKYCSYQDNLTPDIYESWCRKWFYECRRVAQRVIITPGHGNLWMWGNIEKPFGIGSWFKPGNMASSVLGWCCWEPWLYYSTDRKILGGPDSIRMPVTKQIEVGDHPCPKPLSVLSWLIEKTTEPGDIVLDPFVGSGTTCLAAKNLSRRYIGLEIDQHYVDQARGRLGYDDLFEPSSF